MGVVGLDQDCWRAELEDAGSSGLQKGCCNVDRRAQMIGHLCKNQEEGGSARAWPWPLRCLSQFLSEREQRLLGRRRWRMSMRIRVRTFHRWGDHVFIVYVFQLDSDQDSFPLDEILSVSDLVTGLVSAVYLG